MSRVEERSASREETSSLDISRTKKLPNKPSIQMVTLTLVISDMLMRKASLSSLEELRRSSSLLEEKMLLPFLSRISSEISVLLSHLSW